MSPLQNALADEAQFTIDVAESRIRALRQEASSRLAAITSDRDDQVLSLCRLIFGILTARVNDFETLSYGD